MDQVPTHCTCGQRLAHPNVKCSWVPCRCTRAMGRPLGHDYTACVACWREYREGGCDVLVDGYDRTPDISGVVLGALGEQDGQT